MARLIATRVNDEAYAKMMGKCAGLGCSVYDYLKMLVETDTLENEQTEGPEEKIKQLDRTASQERDRFLAGLTQSGVDRILAKARGEWKGD